MHASAYKTPCMLLNGWSLSACICPVIITGDIGLTFWKMCQIDITGKLKHLRLPIQPLPAGQSASAAQASPVGFRI